MVKVTPVTIAYTLLLSIAVLTLILPAIAYYTQQATNSTFYQNLNNTAAVLNHNFMTNIYSNTYSAVYNSSSGLKAAGSLQQFTGLAFMFGAIYQTGTAALQGLPLLSTLLGYVAQYSILPNVDVFAFVGLFITGCIFLLSYWLISNWTKVEA